MHSQTQIAALRADYAAQLRADLLTVPAGPDLDAAITLTLRRLTVRRRELERQLEADARQAETVAVAGMQPDADYGSVYQVALRRVSLARSEADRALHAEFMSQWRRLMDLRLTIRREESANA